MWVVEVEEVRAKLVLLEVETEAELMLLKTAVPV